MTGNKNFWLRLSLINLVIVALLGFTLRSKILFPLGFIDYRNFLSAHSHFAFSGWVGLALTTLLIYLLLPAERSGRKVYQWILALTEISSLGMAISFPIQGYAPASIFFSSLYILINYFFAFVFIKDLLKIPIHKHVKLLAVASIISLLLSAVGPFGLAYILMTKSINANLYRDSIYVFLHFQYNGFFTLAVFAIFFDKLIKKGIAVGTNMKWFVILLTASVLPSVFLALLWHKNAIMYGTALIGCILVLLSLFFFTQFISRDDRLLNNRLARNLLRLSFLSFALKLLLNAGTIIPELDNEIYGDHPVIIGFLHLVFLGFVTFFILSQLIEMGIFSKGERTPKFPFYVFATAVILNETILMVQGLEILFKTNSGMYSWLLWFVAILLLTGAFLISVASLRSLQRKQDFSSVTT